MVSLCPTYKSFSYSTNLSNSLWIGREDDAHQFKGSVMNGVLLYWKCIFGPCFKIQVSWLLFFWKLYNLLRAKKKNCCRKPRQRLVTVERKAMRQQRELASQENFISTPFYAVLQFLVLMCMFLVVIMRYILTVVIPRASVRLFNAPPILLHDTFLEKVSSKQHGKNPN